MFPRAQRSDRTTCQGVVGDLQMFAEELVGDVQNESVLSRLRSLDVSDIVNSSSFETLNYAVDSYLIHENCSRFTTNLLSLLTSMILRILLLYDVSCCRCFSRSTYYSILTQTLDTHTNKHHYFLLAPYNNTLSSPEVNLLTCSDLQIKCDMPWDFLRA